MTANANFPRESRGCSALPLVLSTGGGRLVPSSFCDISIDSYVQSGRSDFALFVARRSSPARPPASPPSLSALRPSAPLFPNPLRTSFFNLLVAPPPLSVGGNSWIEWKVLHERKIRARSSNFTGMGRLKIYNRIFLEQQIQSLLTLQEPAWTDRLHHLLQ